MIILVLNIISFFICAGVLAATAIHRSWMQQAFWYTSYYIIFALTVSWALTLVNLWRQEKVNLASFIKSNWKGILCSFVLASLIFISVPKYFRVLSDETNLLSVAKSMTYYRHVHNVTEGKWYYEMFWQTTPDGVEKRPFLFPFFTSLMHTLLGYRTVNVFVLNYFVFWAVLFLLYRLIRLSLGELWALSSLILVVAQPIVALSAASGSYELFNSLFVLASFISLRYFLRNPGHQSFVVLLLNLIMLANVRYESIIFLVVVMIILGLNGLVRLQFFRQSFVYAAVPFFFLPWVWQRILMLGESDSNLAGGSWLHALRLENLGQNLKFFLEYILSFNGQLGYAGLISLAGLIAVVYFVGVFVVKGLPTDKNQRAFLITSLMSIFALFAVVLLYQGGINDHPMNGRLYMPVLIILSILPVFFFASIFKDRDRLAVPVLLGSLAFFAYYHPVAVEDRLSNTLFIIREYRFVDEFLKKNADKNALIICGRPGQLIVDNYGAISYDTANQEVDEILQQYQNHLFSTIYAIQSISYENLAPLPDNVIDSRYNLETVAESQMTDGYFFRISRVKIY